MLVDAGWALDASRRQLERALGVIGRGLGDITRFLVTHVHRDHYTQAVAIRREFGARVGLGAGERPSLEQMHRPDARPLVTQLRRLQAAGAQPLVRRLASRPDDEVDVTDWGMPDDWLEDQATVPAAGRRLRAIRTPGHTQGHLVFADAEHGALFSGDHVLPHITPSIGFEPVAATLPLGDYLLSLQAMRELPDMRLLPAHGPVTTSVHARVDELLAHHRDRLEATHAAIATTATTAYETARILRWTRRGRAFDDLDLFNQMLAVTETAAHLDLLVAQGRLRATPADGGVCYTTTD